MRLVLATLAALALAAPAVAQTPAQPQQKPEAPQTRDRILPPAPAVPRPTAVPCETRSGVIEPVVRLCPLPKDAPWPPPEKPRPKAGIVPLQT